MDLKCFRQNMCVANCWRPSSRRIRHTTGTRAAGIFSIYAGLRRWLPDGMSVEPVRARAWTLEWLSASHREFLWVTTIRTITSDLPLALIGNASEQFFGDGAEILI